VIRVLNLTGTTEGLFIGNLWVERPDWHWFAFHPFSGFEFREIEPGVYEHWVHRTENWALFQGIFYTFPDEQSVNLKDLYIRHPSKRNLWAFKGRSDDAVILSNGYKISPLETEALITTHPAIDGCLVIGTGKPQAGLLIELKDPSSRSVELFDSIWATVERANELSFQKNRLQRDSIAFAEPEKPFIRTDKGTIKRRATLNLYADYIDHFYRTRDEDMNASEPVAFSVDTSSIETITESIRHILTALLPEIEKASSDEDIFSLGLDSLLVFQAVKTIRHATGLRQDQLAPRHLYANPTLAKFSAALVTMMTEARRKSEEQSGLICNTINGVANKCLCGPDTLSIDISARDRLQSFIAEHKRRLGFKMNPFDAVNPNHYMGLNFFFALRPGISSQEAFTKLQDGLRHTLQLIPELDGKMMLASEQEFGYKKGEYRITIPPPPMSDSWIPRQLTYKDLSDTLPSFEKMRDAGFVPSLFRDEDVLDCDPFPAMPADIIVAQANFVQGGCILATNFIHTCLDGMGVMVAIRAWAESCRFLQGDQSAMCDWLDSDSFNHSLPEILYEQEGHVKPAHEVDPRVWGYLPFFPPEETHQNHEDRNGNVNRLNHTSLGEHTECVNGISKTYEPRPVKGSSLPPVPVFPYQPVWPAAPAERSLTTAMFLIPPENVEKLRLEVLADPEAKGVITSVSDIVQAFFWRSAIKSRYRVAKEIRGQVFGPNEKSILELPIDGRPYFSPSLPSSYMGSMLILSRLAMPIETLCSSDTSTGHIAYRLREAAACITPSLVRDTFTLLRSMSDYSKPATANMGIEHMNAMISNMMLFQTSEISFGDGFFAGGGTPEAMRPQIERGHRRFRFLVIYPMRDDGGVELVLGTLPEELKMLKTDGEFTRYAKLVDSQDTRM
jgi:aryl carrier-like protein